MFTGDATGVELIRSELDPSLHTPTARTGAQAMSLDDRSPDDAQRDADALRGTLYDDLEQLRASVHELRDALARELRLLLRRWGW
jgi:hypothetical protein